MKNADKPINPIFTDSGYPVSEDRIYKSKITGLTKREYFAGLAMQGFLANRWSKESIDFHGNPTTIAEFSIQCADELLKQLENEN